MTIILLTFFESVYVNRCYFVIYGPLNGTDLVKKCALMRSSSTTQTRFSQSEHRMLFTHFSILPALLFLFKS